MVERKRIGIKLPADLYQQIKLLALMENKPAQDWIAEACAFYMAQKEIGK